MNTKTKNIIGWVLAGLLGALFLFSAFTKLTGGKEVVDGFTKMGLQNHITTIGIIELLFVILFLIPRTGVLGTVLLISYVGGIFLAHLITNQGVVIPIVFGLLIGITGYIRFPELGQRLFTGK